MQRDDTGQLKDLLILDLLSIPTNGLGVNEMEIISEYPQEYPYEFIDDKDTGRGLVVVLEVEICTDDDYSNPYALCVEVLEIEDEYPESSFIWEIGYGRFENSEECEIPF